MKRLRKLLAITLIFMLNVATLYGGSATWNLNPNNGDWNTATNWTPATVPNNNPDTATFAVSNITSLSFSTTFTVVNRMIFNAGASAFTITTGTGGINLDGGGITNNSGTTQNFVFNTIGGGNGGYVFFLGNATAGSLTAFTIQGGTTQGPASSGNIFFNDTSTAGNGTFTTNGGTVSGAPGGSLRFSESSTAANGTFTTNGGTVSGAPGGSIDFSGISTAANATFTTNGGAGSDAFGGFLIFTGSSTAGNATFTTNGGNGGGFNGSTEFRDTSTAGNATFTTNGYGGGSVNSYPGVTRFSDTSTAGNGIFTNNGATAAGGATVFQQTSTAGSATLIANNGTGSVIFFGDSTGGTARVEVFGNGNLDIGAHNPSSVTIGSIEGTGNVFLGANNLIVGSNNLSTTFSGVIQGANGSFTKVGAGILTFQGGATNNYIADTVSLSLVSGSIINLNFSGVPDTIRSLIVDGVAQPAGVYGSAASGAPNQLPQFAGTGQVRIGVVVLPVITSPLVATGTVGLPFTYQFEASGATSLGVSNLAPGLTFSTSLGAITGIPTATGTFQAGLSASNSFGTTNATLVITVQPAPASGPVIISSTAATGRTGRPFSFQLQTSGGSSATRFTVGGLPPGLNLDPATGFISGTPTSDGSFGLAVSAIDGTATTQATLQLTFTSDPTVPIITSPGTAILTPGQFFTYTITADANGTFGYIGTDGIVHQGPSSAGLPAGLSFDGIDTISGTFTGGPISGLKTEAADRNANGGPRRISGVAGGIVSNVQVFRNGDGGTGTFPLVTFIAARGTVQISTRMAVGTGDNALIGGFIISGTGTTKALIRAIGPSLTQFGVPNALADPVLELRDEAGALLGSNDNWRDSQRIPIEDTGIPPTNDFESAILAFLSPGSYTAIVRGNNNTTGVGLVEVYDLGIATPIPPDNARLANISTRGFVETGDNVIIGGFIIRPEAPATSTRVILRAIGPSLAQFGIVNALANPTLELRDGNGMLLVANNDWQDNPAHAAELIAANLAPTNQLESGIAATLPVGPCTAIVRGIDNTTGVALVEVYALP